MKSKNLIGKIAFWMSVAALVFAIVTLVRALVTGSGIVLAVVVVVGTAIVTGVCAFMLAIMRNLPSEEEEDDGEDAEDTEDAEVSEYAADDDTQESDETAQQPWVSYDLPADDEEPAEPDDPVDAQPQQALAPAEAEDAEPVELEPEDAGPDDIAPVPPYEPEEPVQPAAPDLPAASPTAQDDDVNDIEARIDRLIAELERESR